jgi:Tfp pilus assembly protein PilV
VNATDVSVAHSTDTLPSVCRTYVCHMSRPFEVHRVRAHCIRRVRHDRQTLHSRRQTRSRNAFRVLDRQTRPVTCRRTRLSRYAAPCLNRPSDRRNNSGHPSVCRSATTASDGSRTRAAARVSRQTSASVASNTSDFQFFVALLVSPFHI